MASKKLPAKPTMAQAFQAAQGPAVARPSGRGNGQGPAVARPKDKGIVGEGKDVLKAMGNQVKQDAEFVGAVGKGAVKGAKAVAKGAEKVAGKVANVTVGDVYSAPLDAAKSVAKTAGKVASKAASILGGNSKSSGSMAGKAPAAKKAMPKSVDTSKKGPAAGGKPVDRQYQGGSGSRKYPTNIPKGYTVLTLLSNPPKYKLVPKKSGK
jgi:hypothetical protein